ncbi:hypothetical protein MMC18_001257 [Xylographa bjoerkii]|nr:hypothetical protein [Xylographa bjoerkii]
MDTTRSPQLKSVRHGVKDMTTNVDTTLSSQMANNNFGYWFQEEPAPPPPAPAQGEALLNDNETNRFHDFFNQMEVGRFDDSGFVFEDVVHNGSTEGWLFQDDPLPPPIFQGSTTALARPPDQPVLPMSSGLIDPFNELASSHRETYSQAATTSPTILAAASTLMRNGRSIHHNSHLTNAVRNQFDESPHTVFDNHTSRDRAAFDQHSFAGHTRKMIGGHPPNAFIPTQATMIHNGTRNMDQPGLDSLSLARQSLYGPERSLQNGLVRPDGGSHLQWGSDGNFANNQFFPPAHLETVAHVTDGLLERVQTFAERTSANSTQPSSPIVQRSKPEGNAANGDEQITKSKTEFVREEEDAKVSPRWRKRRKARPEVKEEDDAPGDEEEDWQESIPRRGKRQKRTLGKAGKKASAEVNHIKGRESDSAEHKPGRDNLTEEQRRENHILSEQKRRNLIKQGFDDLSELVPGLKSGGFSKSAMLTQAVEWLESLLDGNARLMAQLGEMAGGSGL